MAIGNSIPSSRAMRVAFVGMNQRREYQEWLLLEGSRDEIIGWLVWNDANGTYTDEASDCEGMERLTLETARGLMRLIVGKNANSRSENYGQPALAVDPDPNALLFTGEIPTVLVVPAMSDPPLIDVAEVARRWNAFEGLPTDEAAAAKIVALDNDKENRHIEGDHLLCELLTGLGYAKTVEAFKAMEKWYS